MELSERMRKTGTEQRIRTPAIWTIVKDYAGEVAVLESRLEDSDELLENALGNAQLMRTQAGHLQRQCDAERIGRELAEQRLTAIYRMVDANKDYEDHIETMTDVTPP